MAKVSVLILAHQAEPYIAQCLQSVLEQRTRHELEILIGEDGSTDRTGAICDEFAARDGRITVLHRGTTEKWRLEGHVTGRRNCLDLFKRATGEYATLLDGDDGWLRTDRIEEQVAILEADRRLSGCYHHTRVMDEQGGLLARWRPTLPPRMGLKDCIATIAPFHTSSFTWRMDPSMRTLLTEGDAWLAGSFDMYLFTCAATRGDLALFDAEASFYRKHGSGISSSGLFAGSNIHRLRILQWQRWRPSLPGDVREHLDRVCDQHLDQLRNATFSPADRRAWLYALVRAPRYFLSAPWRMRKVFSALRGAH